MNRGKILIVGIFALAIGLTGFAWWHHYRQSAQVVENWGARTARLVRRAERVWLLRLSPDDPAAEEKIDIDGKSFGVSSRADISKAAGLIHVRHFLAEDTYFDWSPKPPDCRPQWTFALEFDAGEDKRVLAFDRRCNLVMLLSTQTALRLGPVTTRLQEFVDKLD